jgi:hypothetical protein
VRFAFFIARVAVYNDFVTTPINPLSMASDEPLSDGTRQRLRDVRATLLHVHKTLLEFEREGYERGQGKINNSYEFLQLVMNHPWFAWLRKLSELIVEMDEVLDGRNPTSESTALALIEHSRILLTPNESGDDFQKKYFAAVQQAPEVVLAHAEFAKVLGPARLSKEIH